MVTVLLLLVIFNNPPLIVSDHVLSPRQNFAADPPVADIVEAEVATVFVTSIKSVLL